MFLWVGGGEGNCAVAKGWEGANVLMLIPHKYSTIFIGHGP
jgi:hypothetical protein